MAPLWEAVRNRLERRGIDNRGRIVVPPLAAEARLALGALVQRQPSSQLNLAQLEDGLRRLEVGNELAQALSTLGYPVSPQPAQRRADAAAGRDARGAAREEAARWPEPWAAEWIDSVVRAGVVRGLDAERATELVRRARLVIDTIENEPSPATAPRSRVDLAATVLGDAHALDTGSRLEVAVARALARRLDATDARSLWEAAGVHLDLTSAPVLTWNLLLDPRSGLAPLVGAATSAGVALHLSRMALSAHPAEVVAGAEVLVVENPRVVEAAAQARSLRSLVSANGSPSAATQLLVHQLVESGAGVLYHGDFDAAGLTLCARMVDLGVTPWRMTAEHYLSALHAADADDVDLPLDLSTPPPTPWDPALGEAFAIERRVVHEERLLAELIEG